MDFVSWSCQRISTLNSWNLYTSSIPIPYKLNGTVRTVQEGSWWVMFPSSDIAHATDLSNAPHQLVHSHSHGSTWFSSINGNSMIVRMVWSGQSLEVHKHKNQVIYMSSHIQICIYIVLYSYTVIFIRGVHPDPKRNGFDAQILQSTPNPNQATALPSGRPPRLNAAGPHDVPARDRGDYVCPA